MAEWELTSVGARLRFASTQAGHDQETVTVTGQTRSKAGCAAVVEEGRRRREREERRREWRHLGSGAVGDVEVGESARSLAEHDDVVLLDYARRGIVD